jgi:hypothetical protein
MKKGRRGSLLVFGLTLSGIALLFYIFIKDKQYADKFDEVKLKDSINSVKKNWGNPDEVINTHEEIILIYNNRVVYDFVFKFDKRNAKLTEKWSGD